MSRPSNKPGTLYGIGVGPGDPELITLKAARLLKDLPVIFAASSSGKEYSIALDIIREHIGRKEVEKLPFPMTRERDLLQRSWEANARRVIEVLQQGCDAGFVTLGDPLTYSTFGYLLRTIRRMAPHISIETVPGITSYHAAASRVNLVLAEAQESLNIISGVEGGEALKRVASSSDNIVILKVYRQFHDIMKTVQGLGLTENGIMVSRCGLDGEQVYERLEEVPDGASPEYLSLVIIKKRPRD